MLRKIPACMGASALLSLCPNVLATVPVKVRADIGSASMITVARAGAL